MKLDPETRRLLESWPGATITGVALPARLHAKRSRGDCTSGVGATPRETESPGRWRLVIPNWRPALANELVGVNPFVAGKRKKRDAEVVTLACLAAGVTPATGRRRVSFLISGRYSRFPDPDAPLKAGLDALVRAGALVDDSAQWATWAVPTFERGPKRTIIVLADVE